MATTPPKAPSATLIVLLVGGMLLTGCSNSLWTKYQDMQCVGDCDSPDPAKRGNFEQPVWQTGVMFLGEMLCLVAFLFLNSRLNPFRIASRRSASTVDRTSALHHETSRLSAAPLSRPDESAIGFGESSLSLQREGGSGTATPYSLTASEYDSAGAHDTEAGIRPPLKSSGSVAAAAGAEGGRGMKWSDAVLFWLPAACDVLGTTAMGAGLLFVPVSVYQMLRGALVLWVGLFSVVFLERTLTRAQWVSLGVCMLGVAIVGVAASIGNQPAPSSDVKGAAEDGGVSPLVGVALVLIAQIFTASQFVIEERVMEHCSVEPLLAAGYEGFFGLITTASALLLAYRFYGATPAGEGGYFDIKAGFHQIVDYPKVWSSSVVIAFSIACFNFCGLAVTRTVSATARSTIDSCRTIGIWAVSLFLGWETFKPLQVVGFALLVYGTFIFNGLTSFPHWTGLHRDALPAGATDDHTHVHTDSEEDYRSVPNVRVEDVEASGVERQAAKGRQGGSRGGEEEPLLGRE
ncbi:hypothetical protein JCM11641_007753 [Rhodosporidiobolus odoratus]